MIWLTATGVQTVSGWQWSVAGGWNISLVVFLALSCAAACAFTWRSLDAVASPVYRIGIIMCRTLALALLFAFLLQPTIHFQRYAGRMADLAIVVDVSDSMSRGERDSRLQKAKQLLSAASSEIARNQLRKHVQWYRFAGELTPVSSMEDAFVAQGKTHQTDIQGALNALFGMNHDRPLSGVVLVSDGADTELKRSSDRPIEVGWAAAGKVPINSVLIESSVLRKDLFIEKVEAAPFAFTRAQTPIVVDIRQFDLPDKEVEGFLWQNGSVVQRQTTSLVGGTGQLRFSLFPATLGKQVYTITIPVPEGDEVPLNNRAHLFIDVIRDKIRILHLAGRPSWDQRFLRQTLKSLPKVDLVSFYILRTPEQSSTFGTDGMALIPFPTADIFEGHIEEFDIVIFQDFSPSVVNMDKYLPKIAAFVRKGGALMLLSGGDGLTAGELAGKEFADILPVSLLFASATADRLKNEASFRPRLTAAGKRHPLMNLQTETTPGESASRNLPRLDGVARVISLAPGGLCLAEHPYLDSDDGKAPVFAVKEIEKGRTLAILTDSLWQWRFSGAMVGSSVDNYVEFISQAVSWLTKSTQLDRIRVAVAPSPVPSGEPISIDIEVLDEAYVPAKAGKIKATFEWSGEDGAMQKDSFEALLDSQGKYHRVWTPIGAGPHVLTVRANADGTEVAVPFLVESAGKEAGFLDSEEGILRAIAEATGGAFQTNAIEPKAWRIESVSDRILSRVDISLWDHPLAMGLFLACLFCEWFLRRRVGLR